MGDQVLIDGRRGTLNYHVLAAASWSVQFDDACEEIFSDSALRLAVDAAAKATARADNLLLVWMYDDINAVARMLHV